MIHYRVFTAGLFLLMAACSDGTDDVEVFVSDLKNKPRLKAPDVPALKADPKFSYESEQLRNPFAAYQPPEKENKNPISSDRERTQEPLERYDLKNLALVGTLRQANKTWGLVGTPEGQIHPVAIGNPIGRNKGRIVSIQETALTVKEIIPDGLGAWREQETQVAMPVRGEQDPS